MKNKTEKGTVLITGGCSGIGYAIAKEFAHRGYDLVLASNHEARLSEVCDELAAEFNVKIWSVFTDLAVSESAQQLYEWCKSKHLEVDILVNNAGIFFFGEVVETNSGKVQQMMQLHASTPALLCTLFGRDMKQKRSGYILNISSISAYMPYPGIAMYSSTKRFLKSFSRSLRTELLDYNVNVTCILPGAVSTRLYELSEDGHSKALKTGIMMRPEKLAKIAVKAMFSKKSMVVPGILNRIFLPIIFLIPHGIILLIRRHSKFLPPDQITNIE
jgi:uncharacterized protein